MVVHVSVCKCLQLACRSDVSPSYKKLVMHEADAKYVLRGMMWIPSTPTEQLKVTDTNANLEKLPKHDDEYESYLLTIGRYENEKDFKTAPPAFLDHARRQWISFVRESFE